MSNDSPPQAHAYRHAAEIPDEVWRALRENEADANIILPLAIKALASPDDVSGKQLWIAVYDGTNNVLFVLSCTHGPMGDYPIFIVACERSNDLAQDLGPLVQCLMDTVPRERVFSVFARKPVAEMFAQLLHEACGIQALEKPYYDARLAWCTRDTFVDPIDLRLPVRDGDDEVAIALRKADKTHLEGVAQLCKQFSDTSVPYTLNDARAALEAQTLVAKERAWVHLIQKGDQAPEVACLVAATRASDDVTAISKVFTAPEWRKRGCAARLLHRVCQDIFRERGTTQVVLYVGDTLAGARRVYRRIGFQGLDGLDADGQGGNEWDKWLEIGFEGARIGYW